MARPQKETVDYFPHDAIASDGITLTIIQSKFGNDGYAFWFKLLERLCSTRGHFIDCRNPAVWEFLLAKTNASEDIGTKLLDLLAELGAIDKDLWLDRIIWSENLIDNIKTVYKNRRIPIPQKPSSNSQKPSSGGISTDDNPPTDGVSTDKSTQSKVKYSKVKNTIVSNNLLSGNDLIYGQSIKKAIRIARGGLEASSTNVKRFQRELNKRGIKWRTDKGG